MKQLTQLSDQLSQVSKRLHCWGQHIEQKLSQDQQQTTNFSNQWNQPMLSSVNFQFSQVNHNNIDDIEWIKNLLKQLTSIVSNVVENFLIKSKWSQLQNYSVEHQFWFKLKSICDELLEAIGQFKKFIQWSLLTQPPSMVKEAQNILQILDTQFNLIIDNCLSVTIQPPDTVMQTSKFELQAKLLVNPKFLRPSTVNLFDDADESQNQSCRKRKSKEAKVESTTVGPIVQIFLLNDHHAATLYNPNGKQQIPRCTLDYFEKGKVSPNAINMDVNNGTCNFKNKVQVKKVDRRTDTITTTSTDLFCLIFYTNIEIEGEDHEIWCCSTPFVYHTHSSQRPQVIGCLFWFKSFSCNATTDGEIARGRKLVSPLEVRNEVSWSQLANALKTEFQVITGTTRSLTQSNLRALGIKILGEELFDTKIDRVMVSQENFLTPSMTVSKYREPTDKSDNKNSWRSIKVSHWTWFYSIMTLIKVHLREFWDLGIIEGFIGKQDAQNILMQFNPGTFMIRFSDTTWGTIAIPYVEEKVVVDEHNKHKSRHIINMTPFTIQDLININLTDRIHGIRDGQLTQVITQFCLNPRDKSVAFPINPSSSSCLPGYDDRGITINPVKTNTSSNDIHSQNKSKNSTEEPVSSSTVSQTSFGVGSTFPIISEETRSTEVGQLHAPMEQTHGILYPFPCFCGQRSQQFNMEFPHFSPGSNTTLTSQSGVSSVSLLESLTTLNEMDYLPPESSHPNFVPEEMATNDSSDFPSFCYF